MKDPKEIQSVLTDFHKDKVSTVLTEFSEIAGNQFEGEFNVSGFHREILDLPKNPKSIWGIDRCLRIQDIPDGTHSFVFHMGIFARSIDLNGEHVDPFKDPRFHTLQKGILVQFLELLTLFNFDLTQIEATYLGQLTIGNSSEGSDQLLSRKYDFPVDKVSKDFLGDQIKLIQVKSLANVDITPVEGALVGPRLEIAYRGVEIGTIVFNCFKIEGTVLVPINYVAGYALGIERLTTTLNSEAFLSSIPRYQAAQKILLEKTEAASSSLLEKEALTVIFGAEVLANIPEKLSRHQKEKKRVLQKEVDQSLSLLGVSKESLEVLIKHFR